MIFGKMAGSTYCEGLVDAEKESIFYSKLDDFQQKMSDFEKENPGTKPGFYTWFSE